MPRAEWHPAALAIVRQWQDWEKGISPGRTPCGRGALNPRLLQAFDLLTSTRNAVQASQNRENARQ